MPRPIELLLVGVRARKRQVDVVQHAGIGRPRQARRARHQPLGERRDGARIIVVEERAVAAAHVMHDMLGMVLCRRIHCGVVLVIAFGECVRNQRCGDGGAGAQRDQERTTAFIMLGHE